MSELTNEQILEACAEARRRVSKMSRAERDELYRLGMEIVNGTKSPDDMSTKIITPKTNPHHTVVGKHFAGHSFQHNSTQIYYCDSYDPRQGYWLTNVDTKSPDDRKNVSERAIGRTYHLAEDRDDHWWVHQWNVKVPKEKLVK